MMKLVLGYYDEAVKGLKAGAPLKALCDLPVREAIGRFKYIPTEKLEEEYQVVSERLHREVQSLCARAGKEEE